MGSVSVLTPKDLPIVLNAKDHPGSAQPAHSRSSSAGPPSYPKKRPRTQSAEQGSCLPLCWKLRPARLVRGLEGFFDCDREGLQPLVLVSSLVSPRLN